MALQSNMPENLFNVPAPEAYTVITEVKVEKRKIYSAPDVEGGEPTYVSGHLVTFRTNTHFNQSAKDSQQPIATHGYTIPYEYASDCPSLPYLYSWLKQNIGMFANAVDA